MSISSVPARSQSDYQIIRHENPVIAIDKGPMEIWFLHTAWYERVGPPGKEHFRDYSIKQDSAVRIVRKEAGIPFKIAQNAYISGIQSYNRFNQSRMKESGTLGLTGTISFSTREARYDPHTLTIGSRLISGSEVVPCEETYMLGLALVLIVCCAVFSRYSDWAEEKTNRSRMVSFCAICIPLMFSILSVFAIDQHLLQSREAIGVAILFFGLWGILELFILFESFPRWKSFIESTAFVRGTVGGLLSYALMFYAFMGLWLPVLAWFAIAFGVRILTRLPSALARNAKNSEPPISAV